MVINYWSEYISEKVRKEKIRFWQRSILILNIIRRQYIDCNDTIFAAHFVEKFVFCFVGAFVGLGLGDLFILATFLFSGQENLWEQEEVAGARSGKYGRCGSNLKPNSNNLVLIFICGTVHYFHKTILSLFSNEPTYPWFRSSNVPISVIIVADDDFTLFKIVDENHSIRNFKYRS